MHLLLKHLHRHSVEEMFVEVQVLGYSFGDTGVNMQAAVETQVKTLTKPTSATTASTSLQFFS